MEKESEVLKNLVKRIKRLEDIDEIHRLKAKYCKYADIGWEGAGERGTTGFADCWTEDGEWDCGPAGHVKGREAFLSLPEALKFAIHLAINPSIEIALDGDKATGFWHGFGPIIDLKGEPMWFAGKWFEEYLRTAEGWRIKKLKFVPAFFAPYKDGWGKKRFATLKLGDEAVEAKD